MGGRNLRSLCLIVNGKAAADPALRDAIGQMRKRGHHVDVRVTYEGGDAARLAAEAAQHGVDVVAAAGGDGTVSEVVHGIVSQPKSGDTAVAVVPYGTANDFATCCGILKDDPLGALELAAGGVIHPIDVGKVNDRHFINVASGGFGAWVTAETPTPWKNALGGAAYSLMGLIKASQMTPYEGKLITAEGEERHSLLLMAVGNGRLAGGGYSVAPRALLNDGLLDVMAVLDVDKANLPTLLNELMNVGSSDNQYVIYRQIDKFRIESDQPLHVNLDGEPLLGKTYDFEVLPRRLPFVLPPGAPLVENEPNADAS
jgi:lipid kinase YegS